MDSNAAQSFVFPCTERKCTEKEVYLNGREWKRWCPKRSKASSSNKHVVTAISLGCSRLDKKMPIYVITMSFFTVLGQPRIFTHCGIARWKALERLAWAKLCSGSQRLWTDVAVFQAASFAKSGCSIHKSRIMSANDRTRHFPAGIEDMKQLVRER